MSGLVRGVEGDWGREFVVWRVRETEGWERRVRRGVEYQERVSVWGSLVLGCGWWLFRGCGGLSGMGERVKGEEVNIGHTIIPNHPDKLHRRTRLQTSSQRFDGDGNGPAASATTRYQDYSFVALKVRYSAVGPVDGSA